ncbi:hypothetical protein GCM10011529_25980 [Polymorphobacter glacialis]|uniref:Ribosomal RNA adenine methylase transferase N-terminal domain-containing protein n=1 Tax=Sandarakinorhabdus glacialis TaxID=1614636 RepID=A0A917EA47_9SPHN|nr:methyltransferase domain-containing protein [Polymorphobacter glacialis]GGE18311.1 hypothetical protein GCM10011529_25980 [Polymorphobacter glacialis]
MTVQRGRPRLLFARNFFANPRGVGSVIPSSRRLTQRMMAAVDWTTARTIVEYGPGTGVVTRAVLARMAPEARLFAFETNSEFVAYLQRSIADPRLTVIDGSAETVAAVLAAAGLASCDAAVSSLPFSIMPTRVRLRIVAATAAVLVPGAPFVGYQYSTRWVRELRRAFDHVTVRFEPRNWPPAFVFVARREG